MRRLVLGRQIIIIQQRVFCSSSSGYYTHQTPSHARVAKRTLPTTLTTLHTSDDTVTAHPQQQQQQIKKKEDAVLFTSSSTTSSHSLHDKIHFILYQIPRNAMTVEQMLFCHKTIELLSKQPEQGELAEDLLERVLQEESNSISNQQQKQQLWHRWVMRAWARTSRTTDSTNHPPPPPPSKTKTSTPQPDSSQLPYPVLRAHQLLERMQQRHRANPQHYPAPDITVCDAFLYSCAVSPFPERVLEVAQSLVKTLEEAGNPFPSTLSYNNVLSIWTNHASQQYGAASAAEDWLLRWSERNAAGLVGQAQPDTRSFNRVLHAWTQSAAPDRAYAILQFMVQQPTTTTNTTRIQPDVVSFATVLHGYRANPEMAEQVFQEALEFFVQQQPNNIKTNPVDMTVCLDAAMMAWAYSDRPDAVERVQALLRDAYLFSLQTNHSKIQLEPTAATHRICLHAFLQDEKRTDGIDAATRHLHDMIASCRTQQPMTRKTFTTAPVTSILTTGAFHVVLQGWMDSGRPEAPDQCRQLLHIMMELSTEQGIPCAPEATTFVRCLQVLLKHKCPPQQALDGLEQAEQRRMVNFYVYKLVLQILERYPSYAFVAYDVFQRALANHKRGLIKMESSTLHRLTMDVLLQHRSREALELAFRIVRDDLPEHSVGALELSYTSVLRAFARFGTARAGEVAGELYDQLRKPSSLLQHSARVWGAVIETLVQSGEPKYKRQACDVLQEMALHPRVAGPDRACMDACIMAILCPVVKKTKKEEACARELHHHHHHQQEIERAVLLLEWLVAQYQQGVVQECPSPTTFRTVFDACRPGSEPAQSIQALARSCFSLE